METEAMHTKSKSEYWPIEKLRLWDKNPKNIKPERLNELKTRLKRQGQTKPLLVTEEGVVIGGNQRLKAMWDLGITEVWVSVTAAKTDKEIFDLALTDNEEFGYYDRKQLHDLATSLELSPLELNSYELNLGSSSLGMVLDGFATGNEDDEAIPPLDRDYSHVRSELGGVYQLGRHRLMCGDATDALQVEQLLAGAEADLVFTDPPYGVESRGGRRQLAAKKGIAEIQNDGLTGAKLQDFLSTALGCIPLRDGGSAYVCYDARTQLEFMNALHTVGWHYRNTMVWNKGSMGLGAQRGYRFQHELMLFAYQGEKFDWYGGHDQSDVWDIPRNREHIGDHPTVKPVALVTKAIKNSTKRGDVVVDTFGGSGTTLIAAERLGRDCYMMEIDPRYCDVVRKRYAKLQGKLSQWEEVTAKLPAMAV